MATISFAQTVTGQERKTVAAVIAQAINDTPRYVGPPSFGFTAGGWSINKQSQVISPIMDIEGFTEAKNVITALNIAGLNAEGSMQIIIHGVEENAAKILVAVIRSKKTLLKKALQTDESITATYMDGNVTLPFFPATLVAEKVTAYLTLALKLAGFAQTIKYTSATEKTVDNEKYAFRCFLLRLGFIGPEYKTQRMALLAPLEGNTAFKRMPAAGEVPAE